MCLFIAARRVSLDAWSPPTCSVHVLGGVGGSGMIMKISPDSRYSRAPVHGSAAVWELTKAWCLSGILHTRL